MKPVSLGKILCVSAVFLLTASQNHFLAAAQPAKQDQRPLVAVIRKDGKKAFRRCFRDADNNGFCDNGSEQKWKCKNNCRKDNTDVKQKKTAPAPEKKKVQQDDGSWASTLMPPCASCLLAGTCSGTCAALLKTGSLLQPSI